MKKGITIFIYSLFLFSCIHKESHYTKINGFTQGTTYSITYENKENINYQAEIEHVLAEFDTSLSTYNKQSVISKINTNESLKADHYLVDVFDKAYEVYTKTGGAFDLTVAPLVNLWGFGFTNKGNVTTEKIDSILTFVGMDKISINDSVIIKSDPRIMLDANAIAQGYSVDIIGDFLEKKGIENYLVEIGGETKTKGVNTKGKAWRIGIDKPIDSNMVPGLNLQAIINLSDRSLATSGNYRKFYIENGIKYSHTINPKDGYPVKHSLLSVTVTADDCMTADAYATAFMVMGLEKSYKLVQQLPGIEAFFIYSDDKGLFNVKSTPNLRNLIEEVE